MVSIKEALATISIIHPKFVLLTGKSGIGKTYFSNHLKGYTVLELDVIILKIANKFKITPEHKAFSIYKNKQPEHITKTFVGEIHSFFDRHQSDPIVIDGAIKDASLVRRIFSGQYSVMTFVYLYAVDVKAYAMRMMKRYKDEKKRGIRSLAIWSEITPAIEALPLSSPKLFQFMIRMVRESKAKSKEHFGYFSKAGFSIYRVNM